MENRRFELLLIYNLIRIVSCPDKKAALKYTLVATILGNFSPEYMIIEIIMMSDTTGGKTPKTHKEGDAK